jgi:NADPH2:quinone reductase
MKHTRIIVTHYGGPDALQDLIALFDLLQQQKIKPLIARRFPLAEARHAHEMLGKGGVTGKIVLVRNGASPESGAA